jgi:hypothetical protein
LRPINITRLSAGDNQRKLHSERLERKIDKDFSFARNDTRLRVMHVTDSHHSIDRKMLLRVKQGGAARVIEPLRAME